MNGTNSLALARNESLIGGENELPAVVDANTNAALEEITGHSPALLEVLEQVKTVARTDSTVLIVGETGTGKELIAKAIHRQSARARGAFVKLNCAAIPANLLESELFGHERGAFTGALTRRTGRFELAQDGTFFLDEIGEMSTDLQPKLLRVLQEHEFERVGSSHTISSNARLVAATHRDLDAMVDERTFREDLYYRLNVFPIRVPPLRARRGDIQLLARAFAQQFARSMNKDVRDISTTGIAKLEAHAWPGNIRELQNVIERAVIMARGPILEISLDDASRRKAMPLIAGADELTEIERAHIVSVLKRTNWVVGGPNGAAARLGMKRSTLNFRMKKLGITRDTSQSHVGQ